MLTAPKYEWHEVERNGTLFEGELIRPLANPLSLDGRGLG